MSKMDSKASETVEMVVSSEIITADMEAMIKGAESVGEKWGSSAWENAEKSLDEDTRGVIGMMLKTASAITTGKDFSKTNEKLLKVLGEKNYLTVRTSFLSQFALFDPTIKTKNKDKSVIPNKLENDVIEESTKVKKKAPKPGSKAAQEKGKKKDVIREESTVGKINDIITEMIKTLNDSSETEYFVEPFTYFRHEILEIRLMSLIYTSWYMLKKYSVYNETKIDYAYDIIVTIERLLQICSKYIGIDYSNPITTTELSKSCIDDLNSYKKMLIKVFDFNGLNVYRRTPKLVVASEHDNILPTGGVSLRENQRNLIDKISKNYKDGILITDRSQIGSGKTTFVVLLTAWLREMKKIDESLNKTSLIFACNNNSVKNQAAQLVYNANLPFAIAYVDCKRGLRIVNNFITDRMKEFPTVIICDAITATNILKIKSGEMPDDLQIEVKEKAKITSNDFMLMHDEPTMGADTKGPSLKANTELLLNMPKVTILSSATISEIEKMPNILNKYKTNYSSAKVDDVILTKIYIGCDVQTFDGKLITPHLGCKTSSELEFAIKTIRSNPFLGRVYTSNVVLKLYELMNNNKIKEIPNIKEYFADINNLNADVVRETAMKMLDILSTQTDKIIKNICNEDIGFHITEIPKGMEKETSDSSDESFTFEDDKKEDIKLKAITSGSINVEHLGTTEAHRLFGQTLVVDIDPCKFAKKNFADLLEKFNKKCPDGIIQLITDYEKKLDERDAKIEYLTKETFKTKTKKTDEDDNPRDDSKFDKTDIMTLEDRIAELPEPTIQFPEWAQVKTIKHTKKFAESGTIIDPKSCRTPLSIEHLNFDKKTNTTKTREKHVIHKLHITEDILTLLFCGIGIYSPASDELSSNYLSLVLSLAKDGKLAYLIADASICYGTNYPINIVIVSEEFAQLHSLNTLFQLFGRAGRVGQSWVARAIIDFKTAQRLTGCAQGSDDGFDVEANNINSEAEYIEKEKDRIAYEKTKKILLEEEEKLKEEMRLEELKKKVKTSTQIAIDELKTRDAIARELMPVISVSAVGSLSTKVTDKVHDKHDDSTVSHPISSIVQEKPKISADSDDNWRRTSSKVYETNTKEKDKKIRDYREVKKDKVVNSGSWRR